MAKDPSIGMIRGRLAADPELRHTNQGTSVVTLSILSSGWEKDTAGNRVDVTPTSWRCEAWRDMAEHIAQSFGKGDQVLAIVRPKTDKYTTDDGAVRYSTKWVIDDIGPSLAYATTAITRTKGRHAAAVPQQPAGPDPDFDGYAGQGEW